jgi:hypothetical protein
MEEICMLKTSELLYVGNYVNHLKFFKILKLVYDTIVILMAQLLN